VKENLKYGFKQLLTHRNSDGLVNIWNDEDSKSLWLAAFIAKTTAHLKKFVIFENAPLRKLLEFLANNQAPDDSFALKHDLRQAKLQGGSSKDLALTAYITIALLENEDYKTEFKSQITKAKNFIANSLADETDLYSLAIGSYALALADQSSMTKLLDKLDIAAMIRNNDHYSMETAAYAVLSFVKEDRLLEALPLFNFLVNNLEEVEFDQKSLISLQAIVAMNKKLYTSKTEMQVGLTINGVRNTERLSFLRNQNEIVKQFQTDSHEIEFSATGSGVALMEIAYHYEQNVGQPVEAFKITTNVTVLSNMKLEVTACANVAAGHQTDSAVMEITLPQRKEVNVYGLEQLNVEVSLSNQFSLQRTKIISL